MRSSTFGKLALKRLLPLNKTVTVPFALWDNCQLPIFLHSAFSLCLDSPAVQSFKTETCRSLYQYAFCTVTFQLHLNIVSQYRIMCKMERISSTIEENRWDQSWFVEVIRDGHAPSIQRYECRNTLEDLESVANRFCLLERVQHKT